MKKIALTQGKHALVNDEDFERLNSFKWYANKRGHNYYAVRSIRINKKKHTINMHREILKSKDLIDHINGNGLDNRRENLRICINKENVRNAKARPGSSVYKGVSKNKATNKWEAYITVDYKRHYLGLYLCEIEAALAYDKAAIKYFKEFARLNIETKKVA